MAHPTSPHAGTLPRLSSHWTGWGQWLALITMTVDHLTRYVLPGDWDLSWAGSSIGRIASRCLPPWWPGTACLIPATHCATRAEF